MQNLSERPVVAVRGRTMLQVARGIDNKGQISTGLINGQYRAFLLSPVSTGGYKPR
jgi:hypothetical protein